jgi:predicted AlkP superfamily phosphohydrolase/phosphomutase
MTVIGGTLASSGLTTYCNFGDSEKQGKREGKQGNNRALKLYWFIPDGLRADPTTFQIFRWASEDRLPNIKKMMEKGSYGYSIPVFPGHTPTNFATLLTGSTPKIHGIADGPMRIEGYPLKMVSKGGFSSIAKKVPPIWYTLEQQQVTSTLLSIPGSTPPELNRGVTIRGRWGGWGLDFPAINFHSSSDRELRVHQGFGNRVFYYGSELTKFIRTEEPKNWEMDLPNSHHPPREIVIENWGATIYGYIYASNNNAQGYYDRIIFSKDKKQVFAHLEEGQWSDWLPINLFWQTKNDYNIHTPKRLSWERELSSLSVKTDVKIKIIKLGRKDFFRIRLFYNNLNNYLARPSDLVGEITETVGPMVDFVDNYPPQLIYLSEDKQAFLEEAQMSLNWHRRMVDFMVNRIKSDVIIQSTYTPNQMLTSRWWLGYIDPRSPRYNAVSDSERKQLWSEVLGMYLKIDAIIGEIINNVRKDCYVLLSSDHGAVPLHREVRLNNLFAREGLLVYRMNSESGEYEIDWEKTQVVFLKMDNVYINPGGLAGNYRRASGAKYENLRTRVIKIINNIIDAKGIRPVERIVKWENAEELDLPRDRVGDLIIANRPNYGWIEEISPDLEIFKIPLKSGYKQAILAEHEEAMWTPFVIMGPGIRKNYPLPEPVRHIDQYPTIMKLLNKKIPSFVEGKPLDQIFRS